MRHLAFPSFEHLFCCLATLALAVAIKKKQTEMEPEIYIVAFLQQRQPSSAELKYTQTHFSEAGYL